MSRRRVDELNIPLTSSKELEIYIKKVRDLCKDMYLELDFAASELQQNLSTVPVVNSQHAGGLMGSANSRRQARRVARCLKRASEAQKYAGSQAVRTWQEFTRAFVPDQHRGKPNRRRFNV